MTLLKNENPRQQYDGAQKLRLCIAGERSPIQEVINAGFVPLLVSMMKSKDEPCRLESGWCIENLLSSADSKHVKMIYDFGVLQLFIPYLYSSSEQMRDIGVGALSNLAGDSPVFRDEILNCSSIMTRLPHLFHPKATVESIRDLAWFFANLTRTTAPFVCPSLEKVQHLLPCILAMLQNKDDNVVTDAAFVVKYLTESKEESQLNIQTFLATRNYIGKLNVAQVLIQLLAKGPPSAQHQVLRVIGNILAGAEEHTQLLIDNGVIPVLRHVLLNAQKVSIRKETVWSLSNVTAGTIQQIQAVLDAGLVAVVAKSLTDHFTIQKEAVWFFANIANSHHEHTMKVISGGIPTLLCQVLSCNDVELVVVILNTLNTLLFAAQEEAVITGHENTLTATIEECGGLDLIEKLQLHPNETVYLAANELLQAHFQADDELGGGDGSDGDEDDFLSAGRIAGGIGEAVGGPTFFPFGSDDMSPYPIPSSSQSTSTRAMAAAMPCEAVTPFTPSSPGALSSSLPARSDTSLFGPVHPAPQNQPAPSTLLPSSARWNSPHAAPSRTVAAPSSFHPSPAKLAQATENRSQITSASMED